MLYARFSLLAFSLASLFIYHVKKISVQQNRTKHTLLMIYDKMNRNEADFLFNFGVYKSPLLNETKRNFV